MIDRASQEEVENDKATKATIIIVSYNSRDLTLACLRSINIGTLGKSFEIVVVDNCSSDQSADAISREFPGLRLIRSSTNLGFSAANNLATEGCRSTYILLLNPDTLVINDAITSLVGFADRNRGAGIWGGRTLFADGSLNPTSCWRFMSIWSLLSQAIGLSAMFRHSTWLNPEGYGGWKRDSVRQVDIVSGCFLLIRRDLWEQLHGFDERFHMYAEEADLCYRARALGKHPLFTPGATIIHLGGGSEPIFSAKVIRLFRGKITFIMKHWPQPQRCIGVTLFKLGALIRMICYKLKFAMTKLPRDAVAASEWREIWAARKSWSTGYPSVKTPDHNSSRSSASVP